MYPAQWEQCGCPESCGNSEPSRQEDDSPLSPGLHPYSAHKPRLGAPTAHTDRRPAREGFLVRGATVPASKGKPKASFPAFSEREPREPVPRRVKTKWGTRLLKCRHNLLSYLCWLPMERREQWCGKYKIVANPPAFYICLENREGDFGPFHQV